MVIYFGPVSSKTEIASSETTNGTERGAGKVPGTRAIPGSCRGRPDLAGQFG